ncbi:MAG: Xaa-Pro peptidase family protein [Candidatus Peribacteraceae bacterium]|nr:Xaa-Pro peptidase family protein [Candidatus Peribacteraceae bacterium]MDD5074766.1 Xaa-Pro peptidase family protein [Candidatus Peribacteraceae bacterium]
MRPIQPKTALRRADNLSALLITNLINIRYLTGVDVSAGAMLVTPRSWRLFVDARYGEMAQSHIRTGIKVEERELLARFLESVPLCGCEEETVTLAQYRRWKKNFKNTKFVQLSGMIEDFRRSKDTEELRKFRRAQKITQQMLTRVPAVLRPGITERALAWKLTEWAHELKADGLAFEPIVAFGPHTSRPHHHATDREYREGDLVQVDTGARFGGYCADQSRVFFTGPKTSEQAHVFQAVEEAKDAATKMVRAGVGTHELDRVARAVLKKHGLEKYFVHSLGHGVGLEIHEGVTLSQKRPNEKLLKNEIITIEPGVYLPGKFGMRLEDEIVVEKEG